MFLSSGDEVAFNKTLVAYEQEFGADKVIIVFPKSWSKKIDPKKFHPVKVESWDVSAIGLRVLGCSANFTLQVAN